MNTSDQWWKTAALVAGGAVVAAVAVLLLIRFANVWTWGLLILGLVVFVAVLFLNPAYFYRRLGALLTTVVLSASLWPFARVPIACDSRLGALLVEWALPCTPDNVIDLSHDAPWWLLAVVASLAAFLFYLDFRLQLMNLEARIKIIGVESATENPPAPPIQPLDEDTNDAD